MREVVLGVAAQGLFEPRWSDRILEEWARATPKLGEGAEAVARGEIALLSARFPRAIVPGAPHVEQRLWLSDENDIHVLASAIAGSCDAILTINAKDFPKHVLAEEGVARLDPDGFLYSLWLDHPAQVQAAVEDAEDKLIENILVRKFIAGELVPAREEERLMYQGK